MDIKLINRGNTGELLLDGRLDAASAADAEPIMMDVADRFDTVVLNLENLDYTSSAGLRLIRSLQSAMNRKDGELQIRNAKSMVMEVFEMTGFASFLKFVK